MVIKPMEPARKARLLAALTGLGHTPSHAEAAAIAAAQGAAVSTTRLWGRRMWGPREKNTAQDAPGATKSAQPKAQHPAKERASPAIRETIRPDGPVPARRDSLRMYRSDECCGAEWTLVTGEAEPGACPACGQVFA